LSVFKVFDSQRNSKGADWKIDIQPYLGHDPAIWIPQEQWWVVCCNHVKENGNKLDVITKELAIDFLKSETISP